MNKKEKATKQKAEALERVIGEYLKSDKTMSEFIKEHMFKDYSEGGDKKLEEIATQYFIDHLK